MRSKFFAVNLFAISSLAIVGFSPCAGATPGEDETKTPAPGYASFPAYLAGVYDFRAKKSGFTLLNSDGGIFGQPVGSIKPLATIDYKFLNLSSLNVPQYLNATYSGLNLFKGGNLSNIAFGDLLNLWQSGNNALDVSYGLTKDWTGKDKENQFIKLGGMAAWKRDEKMVTKTSGRILLQGQFAHKLWPLQKPEAQTDELRAVGDMDFAETIPPLSDAEAENAALYFTARFTPERFQSAPERIQSLRTMKLVDFLKDANTNLNAEARQVADQRSEAIAKAIGRFEAALPDATLSTATLVRTLGRTRHLTKQQLASKEFWLQVTHAPLVVSEYFKPGVAAAKQAEAEDNGPNLKFYVQGFAWYDTQAGSRVKGFGEAGLVFAFGTSKSSGGVRPGISLTYLDGEAPSSLKLGQGFTRLNLIIPF